MLTVTGTLTLRSATTVLGYAQRVRYPGITERTKTRGDLLSSGAEIEIRSATLH